MRKSTKTNPQLQYRNPFMSVNHTRADFGDFQKDYFVVELGPRAGIVVVNERRVLLTRQYRFLIDDYSWELPGGMVDSGEDARDAAVRECIEETGIRCANLRPLVTYYPGLDNFNNRTSLFFSDQCSVVSAFKPDASEVVAIEWIELADCLRMVFSGEILDAMTVAGLLAVQARKMVGA